VPERRAAGKEQAMHERFEKRIEEASERFRPVPEEETEAGDDRHTRGTGCWGGTREQAALFEVKVEADAGGFARLRWSKVEAWREWAALERGCYVLRSNVTDWSPEDLWRATSS